MQEKKQEELKNFIKENSNWIYEFINTEILKNIGVMNYNYFLQITQELFEENSMKEIPTSNMLPYFIFTQFSQQGTIAYTSLRVETLDFKQIDKEAKAYYNYARFSIKNDCLCIELMQSKIGGMPIDGDIVKFTKNIPIKYSGLEEFINTKK